MRPDLDTVWHFMAFQQHCFPFRLVDRLTSEDVLMVIAGVCMQIRRSGSRCTSGICPRVRKPSMHSWLRSMRRGMMCCSRACMLL